MYTHIHRNHVVYLFQVGIVRCTYNVHYHIQVEQWGPREISTYDGRDSDMMYHDGNSQTKAVNIRLDL
jgi:hypothetical protein